MGLFSSKNKRDRTAQDSGRFYSKDDDAAVGERARAKRASHAGATAGASSRRSANDPMLPEKKRARRRLVGAIALALGAAVGLPMLLDSSPKPLAGDIAIDIPAKDKAAALPVPAVPAASAPAASTAAPAAAAPAPRERTVTAVESIDKGEEVIAAPPPPRLDAHKAEPKPQAVAEQPRSEHKEARAEHKDATKPEHKDAKADARLAEKADKTDKPAKPKLEDKPVKPRDEARALAILEGKPAEPKPEAASSQKSVLQVAAVSSADKAAELQAKLRDAGVSAYTEKAPGGLIRVKVAFSKDEAEKVRAKLAKLGL
jgi:DedD protein